MTPFRVISGKKLIKVLCKKYGYENISQNGSHIKLRYDNGESLIIPNHKEIKSGTFNNILRFVSEDTGKSKKEIFMDL